MPRYTARRFVGCCEHAIQRLIAEYQQQQEKLSQAEQEQQSCSERGARPSENAPTKCRRCAKQQTEQQLRGKRSSCSNGTNNNSMRLQQRMPHHRHNEITGNNRERN